MSRYIDLEEFERRIKENVPTSGAGNTPYEVDLLDWCKDECIRQGYAMPTADVVEVRHDFNVGDFCLYGFADGNKSLAIIEIVKILDDERGIAELKFHKVIKDNTGNGYFHYLFKSGHTMNGSFKYLKNITPKMDGERREE